MPKDSGIWQVLKLYLVDGAPLGWWGNSHEKWADIPCHTPTWREMPPWGPSHQTYQAAGTHPGWHAFTAPA
jgi:hypothetical protein